MTDYNTIIDNALTQFGTPLHLYFPEKVADAARQFQQVAKDNYPNTQILFAVKSNPCSSSIHLVNNLGLGVDVVSEYELKAAIVEGMSGERVVCNGNAKTDAYIIEAIEYGATIAADSFDEVQLISKYSQIRKSVTKAIIRLSGMELDGLTSPDQSTASHWTKFGIPYRQWRQFFELAKRDPFIQPVGISAHIGTQIVDARGYERLITTLLEIIETAQAEGIAIQQVDLGGGFPLSYLSEEQWNEFRQKLKAQRNGAPKSEWVTWGEFGMGGYGKDWTGKGYWSAYPGAKMLEHLLNFRSGGGKTVAERLLAAGNPTLTIEPGRGLFGEAGITLAEVIGVKEVEVNHLVILNLGIVNHGTVLVTPDIYPMSVYPPLPDDKPVEVFVAGRLCFTGDMISKVKIPLNRMPRRGDIVIIEKTGAYCADHFASNSCGYPRPAKVAVGEDGSFEVWRKGETFEDVFG